MATRISTARRNAACDSVVDAIDVGTGTNGSLEIRTGSQPAGPDSTATGTVLATFTLPEPAFGSASAGVATANAISDATGAAAGTAGYFRVYDENGTAVMDGSVTATGGGGDMELNTTTISVGLTVSITSWTVTMPGG